jgi:hypothetical protein
MLKDKKYFYFLKFKLIILNNKYIIFIKNKIEIKNCFIINSKLIKPLFNNIKILNLLKHNYYLLCFNKFNIFNQEKIKNINIYSFMFSGFFINNNFIKNIKNYYLFYTKNYKIFIYFIFYFFEIYKYLSFIYLYKFLVLLI